MLCYDLKSYLLPTIVQWIRAAETAQVGPGITCPSGHWPWGYAYPSLEVVILLYGS